MSPLRSNEPLAAPASTGPHRKPRPDLYTVFLVIALVALLIGLLFLYLEMSFYEFKVKGAPPVAIAHCQGTEITAPGPELACRDAVVGRQCFVLRNVIDSQWTSSVHHSSFIV